MSAARLMSLVAVATNLSHGFPVGKERNVVRALLSSEGRASWARTQRGLLRLVRRVSARYGRDDGMDEDEDSSDDEDEVDESGGGKEDDELVFRGVVSSSEEALSHASLGMDAAEEATRGSEKAAALVETDANKKERWGYDETIPKPQLNFHDWPIDNSVQRVGGRTGRTLNDDEADGRSNVDREEHSHPSWPILEECLDALWQQHATPPDEREESPSSSMNETVLTFVETRDQLKKMMKRLRRVQEIAVDLEHHDYRSFQGFTCLVQISTRTEDFVIDAIALREHLSCLNEVFMNGKIVKVFHGALSDVQWLDRDFGVYLVGLFDTGQAAKILGYPSMSLAYLLERFCKISSPDKKIFQTADWRRRPLPDQMLQYARQDTHFLLYIYDCLRKELGQTGHIRDVWYMSRNVGLTRYQIEQFHPQAFLQHARKLPYVMKPQQLRVLEELFKWRDETAREQDESIAYVLPNRAMMSLSLRSETINSLDSLMSCIRGGKIPQLVVKNSETVLGIILNARKGAEDSTRPFETTKDSAMHDRAGSIRETEIECQKKSIRDDPKTDDRHNPAWSELTEGDPSLQAATLGGIMVDAAEAGRSALFRDNVESIGIPIEYIPPEVANVIERSEVTRRMYPSNGDGNASMEIQAPPNHPKDSDHGREQNIANRVQLDKDDENEDFIMLSLQQKHPATAAKKSNKGRRVRKLEVAAPSDAKDLAAFDYSENPFSLNVKRPRVDDKTSFNPYAILSRDSNSQEGRARLKTRQGNVRPKSGRRSLTYLPEK